MPTDIEAEINKLRQEMQEMDARFIRVEKRLGRIEEELNMHSGQLARLDQRVIDLKETLDVERRLARLEAQAGLARE